MHVGVKEGLLSMALGKEEVQTTSHPTVRKFRGCPWRRANFRMVKQTVMKPHKWNWVEQVDEHDRSTSVRGQPCSTPRLPGCNVRSAYLTLFKDGEAKQNKTSKERKNRAFEETL